MPWMYIGSSLMRAAPVKILADASVAITNVGLVSYQPCWEAGIKSCWHVLG